MYVQPSPALNGHDRLSRPQGAPRSSPDELTHAWQVAPPRTTSSPRETIAVTQKADLIQAIVRAHSLSRGDVVAKPGRAHPPPGWLVRLGMAPSEPFAHTSIATGGLVDPARELISYDANKALDLCHALPARLCCCIDANAARMRRTPHCHGRISPSFLAGYAND